MVPARLLDLTRLVSRVGRGPLTGIDRVELAYLLHLLGPDTPLFGLVRTSAGWLLLNRAGCAGLADMAQGKRPLPDPDLMSRILLRGNPIRARAETAARHLAMARAARPGLTRLLRKLPNGTSYLNVGHANLTHPGLASIKRAGCSVTVLIHDTIPLDHPEFARPDTIAPFKNKLAAVSACADQVIHITQAARISTDAQLSRLGRVPPGLVANIGVTVAKPDPAALPDGLGLSDPYFVTLGTIEPRKNHALLLDVWDRLPTPKPRLFILGSRGWASEDLLARLDALPHDGPVRVLTGLSDGAVAAILHGARALLAPSRAEGFGLPPVEAAALGTPVIAADLAVTRELLEDKAVYLNASDIYSWMETIIGRTQAVRDEQAKMAPLIAPDWDAHFKAVLSLA